MDSEISEILEMPDVRNTFELTLPRIKDFHLKLKSLFQQKRLVVDYKYNFVKNIWVPSQGRFTFCAESITYHDEGIKFQDYFYPDGSKDEGLSYTVNNESKFAFLRSRIQNGFGGLYLSSSSHSYSEDPGSKWIFRRDDIFYFS